MGSRRRGGSIHARIWRTTAVSFVAGGTLLATLGSGAGASTKGRHLTVIRVGQNLSVGALPTYVAMTQGFAKKHGLEIQITKVLNPTEIPSELGPSKQLDFGQTFQPLFIFAANQGLPVVATEGGDIESAHSIDAGVVVKKDSGIKTPQDFIGKTIAVATPNGNDADELKYWLKHNGVQPTQYTLTTVTTSNMLAELQAGQVNAAYMVAPFTQQAVNTPGLELLVNPALKLGVPVSEGSFMISNTTWAKQHTKTVLAFEEATQDSIAWIKKHESKAQKLLAKFTGAPVEKGPVGPLNSAEPLPDLTKWFAIMKTVVPNFQTKLTPKSLVVEPILHTKYSPNPNP